MLRVTVPLADRSYDVLVGAGALSELDGLLPASASRVAVVTQPGIPFEWTSATRSVETYEIGIGESAKSLSTIEALTRGFARQGLTRRDVVVGHEDEGWVEVRSGVEEGEAVATTGAFLLKSELLKGTMIEEE